MTKSIFFSVIILLVISVFDSAILSNITFLPAVPDFLMLAVIYMSLKNGRGYGTTVGFISGLFWDSLTGCPFGFNCLLRSLLGYFPGFFSKTINYSGFFIPAAFGLLATISKIFATWIISLFYPNLIVNYDILSFSLLFELLCNTFLAPLVFKILGYFSKYFTLNDGEI
ncbi:MAG: rod shape-determining protein MreD [Treponema sp.]|nr:rod shape-determining protein MreD [Treponema sp.]